MTLAVGWGAVSISMLGSVSDGMKGFRKASRILTAICRMKPLARSAERVMPVDAAGDKRNRIRRR
jgi:hypothetical protein